MRTYSKVGEQNNLSKMKNKLFKLTFGLTLLALLVASQVRADDHDFLWIEDNNQVTFSYNDMHFIAKAGGQVPKFQFMIDNDFEGDFEYAVMFHSLTEYLDYNQDGIFQFNESGLWQQETPAGPVFSSTLSLSAVRFAFSGFNVEYIDGTEDLYAVHFNYTSETINAPNYSGFEITIVVHIYMDDQVIDGYELKGGQEMKFDIIMNNWPWQRDDTNLAMRFDIIPMNSAYTYRLNDTNGKPLNTDNNTTGYEYQVLNHGEAVKEQFSIGDEKYQAFFAYANQAQYLINNSYEYKTVNCSVSSLGDGSLQTYLSFEHFDDEITYDPSIGSLEDLSLDETGFGVVEIVTISAVSVLAMTFLLRKLKK